MYDPYAFFGTNLYSPSRLMVLITPSDDDDLDRACKALRIFNTTASVASVAIETVGGSSVTIKVPASSLVIENVIVNKVLDTGTDAGLEIHGYTD